MKTKFILAMALMMGAMTFTSCSSDDNDNSQSENSYKDRTYGNGAIDACDQTVTALGSANEAIAKAQLTEAQETALRQVLTVPTLRQPVSTGSAQRPSWVVQHRISALTPLSTHGPWIVLSCSTISRVA